MAETNQYNYIICGAGAAGLTLLYALLQEPLLRQKQILVIDKADKNENDRTWCFWEQGENTFESIVHHQWKELRFCSKHYNASFSIEPYTYKMIRGIDFYTHVLHESGRHSNVHFIHEHVQHISNTTHGAIVKTNSGEYNADFVFNSIVFQPQLLETPNSLLQHFKGIEIETTEAVFNPQQALFMDFTVNQQHGTAFMYVLPTAVNKALIEYTLFTKHLLPQQEYDAAIVNYINHTLNITSYRITHTEFGIIPMTDYKFSLYDGNIINIGSVAGCVKPSSGFAFRFIQKHTEAIVGLLKNTLPPKLGLTFAQRKFVLYDAVLLGVLAQNKMPGDVIFAGIFKKNKPQKVLKFLDNETNLFEDFRILNSNSTNIFLPITLKKIFTNNV